MSKHPMTVEGAEALKAELHRLKFVDRPRIVEAIATARAHGDLKEMRNITQLENNKVLMKGAFKSLKRSCLMRK